MAEVWALAALWVGLALVATLISTKFYKSPHQEAAYTTLLMSTGLTFGTISALFGLSHGIVDQSQYSALVAPVIARAVVPTVIANGFYLPRRLLPKPEAEHEASGIQQGQVSPKGD